MPKGPNICLPTWPRQWPLQFESRRAVGTQLGGGVGSTSARHEPTNNGPLRKLNVGPRSASSGHPRLVRKSCTIDDVKQSSRIAYEQQTIGLQR